jgi:HEAT repeat protein
MPRPIRHVTAILIFLTAAAVLAAAGTQKDKDPVHEGKKASAWVDSLVNDASARKRALAVEALAKLWAEKQYEESLPSIGRALRVDPSAAVRAQAAIALGAVKDSDIKRVGKDLIDAMAAEKESRVRKEIAAVMSRHTDLAKAGVAGLTEALKDPEPATKIAVADALARAGSDAKSAAVNLAPMLADADEAVRHAAVIALGRISPEGASTIAETMCKMLGAEKDLEMKIDLVTSLGLLGEKSSIVVETLGRLLTDPEVELRRRSTRVLGTFGVAALPAADQLYKVAAADKFKDIRVDAVRAFGSAVGIGLKIRVKEMLALLKDGEFEVRLAVVEEIGALGNELKDDAETIKVLRTRLSDPHLKVREAAAAAIKRIEKKPDPKEPPKDPDSKKPPG